MAPKVLPEAFTADPDRLAHFEREAKVLASLNHTNIGHIYGLGKGKTSRPWSLLIPEDEAAFPRVATHGIRRCM